MTGLLQKACFRGTRVKNGPQCFWVTRSKVILTITVDSFYKRNPACPENNSRTVTKTTVTKTGV